MSASTDNLMVAREGLRALLSDVPSGASTAAYARAARELVGHAECLRPLRVAQIGTYTLQPLDPFLVVEAARAGFLPSIYHGPFNSMYQELLDPQSGCAKCAPDVVFVSPVLSDVAPQLAWDFPAMEFAEAEENIEKAIGELSSCLQAFRRHSASSLVVHNFVLPLAPALGILEPSWPGSQTAAIRRLNDRLAQACAAIPGVYVLDCDRLCAHVGYERSWQERSWYSGRAPWGPEMLVQLATTQAAFLTALTGLTKKCLVVDLDNTLWGGVLGEDGIQGVQLGHDWPGNAYSDIQRYLLQLHQRGVLLAINSKNNPGDVAELFHSHPGMILRAEHFAAQRVNWKPKPENMLEIADELNVGMDSLVFLDDNPAECEMMRMSLPQVMVLAASDAMGNPDPIQTLRTLRATRAFDRLSYTADDRRRGTMYREQSGRRELERSATTLDDFLRQLELVAEISPVDSSSLPRVVDLLQKTNQFNLTTRRHSAAAVREMLDNPACAVFQLRVGDRFGDNGVVGVAIAKVTDDLAEVDSFLLSCRVIGRTVETALLSHVANWARERGAAWMQGWFLPTPKNAPAAEFYPRHGFSQVGRNESNGGLWQIDLENLPFSWPEYISRPGDASRNVTQEPGPAVENQDPVANVMSQLLGVPLADLSDASSPETLPQWDSLNHLNLVMALESALHTSFSPEQALAMRNLGEIRRIVAGGAGSSESEIEFRDARQSDLPAFREFIFDAYGPGYVLGANADYLEWQFRRTAISEGSDFHIRLAFFQNNIAGCLGYVPCEIGFGGRKVKGCWLANWMVGTHYRHLGLGPALVRDVSRDFQTTLALGANLEARDVLARMGWTDFGSLHRHVAVLDRERAQPLAENGVLAWSDSAERLALRLQRSSDVARVARFDASATELWDRVLGDQPSMAGTRRTHSFLNWRYADHRVFEYRLFESRVSSRLVGLGIYRLETARNLPVKIARIVELFGDPEGADHVLATMLCDARESGAAVADHFGGAQQQNERFARHGFIDGNNSLAQGIPTRFQPVDRKKSMIRFLADLRQIPGSPEAWDWYVSKADGDQDRPN